MATSRPKSKKREPNTLAFVVGFAALVGFVFLTTALNSFWLALLAVLSPFILLGIFVWRFPKYRQPVFSGLKFVKTTGFALLTEEALTEEIEKEQKSPRVRIPAEVRNRVKERDKSCRFPKCKVNLTSYDVHHIDQDSSNSLDRKNLLVLCPNHHRVLHRTNRPPVAQSHIRLLRAWANDNYETTYQQPEQWGGNN